MRCKQWGEGSLEESTESVLEGNDAAPSGNVRVVEERSQLVGECDILFRCSLPRVDLVCEKAKAVRITGVRKGVEGDRYPRCKESPQDDRDDVHADLLVNLARFAKGERTDELVGNVARTAGRGVVPDRVRVVGDDRNERHAVERCELASSRPETSALAVDDDKAVAICHGTVCDAFEGGRLPGAGGSWKKRVQAQVCNREVERFAAVVLVHPEPDATRRMCTRDRGRRLRRHDRSVVTEAVFEGGSDAALPLPCLGEDASVDGLLSHCEQCLHHEKEERTGLQLDGTAPLDNTAKREGTD